MSEEEFAQMLAGLLLDGEADLADESVMSAVPFSEAGLLSNNEGLVVELSDGSEFQVTVVRAR